MAFFTVHFTSHFHSHFTDISLSWYCRYDLWNAGNYYGSAGGDRAGEVLEDSDDRVERAMRAVGKCMNQGERRRGEEERKKRARFHPVVCSCHL